MTIIVEQNGPVTTVILNRPHARNAVDQQTATDLAAAFRAFDNHDEAKVAVLCGSDEQFCAGADLKEISAGRPNRTTPDGEGPMGPTRMHLRKPVIAAVAGYAVAGGLELALWCDLRVADENATFGVYCRRFGVPLIDGGTIRLPRLIGLSRALDLILTGRPVTAQEAYEFGLVNRVVKPGCVRQAAEELAHQIASFPQACMRGDRLSAYEQHALPMNQALENELRHGMTALRTEAMDGAQRFASGTGRHGTFEGTS